MHPVILPQLTASHIRDLVTQADLRDGPAKRAGPGGARLLT